MESRMVTAGYRLILFLGLYRANYHRFPSMNFYSIAGLYYAPHGKGRDRKKPL
jgi:hypothetical protein